MTPTDETHAGAQCASTGPLGRVLAFAASGLAHAALLFGMGAAPGQAGSRDAAPAGIAVKLAVAAPTAAPVTRARAASATPSTARANRQPQATAPAPAGAAGGQTDAAPQSGPEQGALPGLLEFDAASYLPPRVLDIPAMPYSPGALDILPLTGDEAGLWQVRLYIGETGQVDELEVLEARGSPANTAELTAVLRTMRFQPAIAGGVPARSQKLLEFSFEPAPQNLLTGLAPALWAAGR